MVFIVDILIIGGLILLSFGIAFATIKSWISWKGGSPIASLTVFHVFQPKYKQHTIEYVIEEKSR